MEHDRAGGQLRTSSAKRSTSDGHTGRDESSGKQDRRNFMRPADPDEKPKDPDTEKSKRGTDRATSEHTVPPGRSKGVRHKAGHDPK
jgi:hypothetical protein